MTYQQYRNEIEALQKQLDAIAAECRKYNHPGCSPAAHELANRILDLATGERRDFQ